MARTKQIGRKKTAEQIEDELEAIKVEKIKKAKRDAEAKERFRVHLREHVSGLEGGMKEFRETVKDLGFSESSVPHFPGPLCKVSLMRGERKPLLDVLSVTAEEREDIEYSYENLRELQDSMLREIIDLKKIMDAVIDRNFDEAEIVSDSD